MRKEFLIIEPLTFGMYKRLLLVQEAECHFPNYDRVSVTSPNLKRDCYNFPLFL
jgi:hypothetical protein